MRKGRAVGGALFVASLCVVACANTDLETLGRKPTDTVDVNGRQYLPADVNDRNAFGMASGGLSDNTGKKPSNSILGSSKYDEVSVAIVPDETKVFVNESVEFEVSVLGKGAEETSFGPAKNSTVVVQLVRADKGNGAISFVPSGYDTTVSRENPPTETQLVLKTGVNGKFRVRLDTGSYYSSNASNPMYYINIWHAALDEPGAAAVYVKQVPHIGDGNDYIKGVSDVVNDLTPPSGISGGKGDGSVMLGTDSLKQQLFVHAEKKLGVVVCGNDAETAQGCTPVAGDTVCINLVTDEHNTGTVKYPKECTLDGSAGCCETDENGRVDVSFNAGDVYDARYYLNFYHPKAMPVSYQIDTFVMPETLGELGDGPEPEIKVEKPSGSDTRYSEKETEAIIKTIFDDETVKKIDEVCRDGDGFVCWLEENEDGTWSLVKPGEGGDDEVVKIDIDGDGKAEEIKIVLKEDEEGKYGFEGVDTDGDGRPDIAPDPCALEKNRSLVSCSSPSYKVKWSKEDRNFSYQKINLPMNEERPVYIAVVEAGSEHWVGDIEFNAEIIRGEYPSNNAAFESKGGPDKMTYLSDAKGIAESMLWTGTAYDATYYLSISSDKKKLKPANIPIYITNSVKVPTGDGDAPDEDAVKDVEVPPGDMKEDADKNLGDCYFTLEKDEIEKYRNGTIAKETVGKKETPVFTTHREMTVPVAKSVMLGAYLVCRDSKIPESGTKTYWKVTRGKSSYNNATLMSSKNETDSSGYASSQFYSGTGVNSVYYISIFHPNAKTPVVYTVTTVNSTGVLPPVDPDDPKLPDGDTTVTDKDGNKKTCCDVKSCAVCLSDEVSGCPDESESKQYIYCAESTDVDEVNGIETSKKLPQRTCSEVCHQKGADGKYADTCPEANLEGGCLMLEFADIDNPVKPKVGTTIPLKAQLIWRTGDEVLTPRGESVNWSIYADESSDAQLNPEVKTTDSKGYSKPRLYVGSKVGVYYVLAMHPNIQEVADGKRQVKPIKLKVMVKDPSQEPSKDAAYNALNVDVENLTSGSKLAYFVMATDYQNKCDPGVALQAMEKVRSSCEKSMTPAAWKKGAENAEIRKTMCALDASDLLDIGGETAAGTVKTIRVPDNDTGYTVYAIAFDEKNNPVQYGCKDGYFLPATKCGGCTITNADEEGAKTRVYNMDENWVCQDAERCSTDKDNCGLVCTSRRDVTIGLEDVPVVLGEKYYIDSLIDLGVLVEIPDASACEGESTQSVGCLIAKIQDAYQSLFSSDPGSKVVELLEDNILMKDTYGKAAGCLTGEYALGKHLDGCYYGEGDNKILANSLDNYQITKYIECENNIIEEARDADHRCLDGNIGKYFYKKSDCACGQIYYYTKQSSLGSLATKLILKGIKSLVNKGFEKANIEETLCKQVDSLQYLKFKGNIVFDTSKGYSVMPTTVIYNGLEIPFINKSLEGDGFTVIRGKVNNGSVDGTFVNIPNVGMTFSYGRLVYDIIGSLLPKGAINDNGVISLSNILNCGTLLGIPESGINIPIVNIKITPDFINPLCNSMMSKLSDKAFSIADTKTINLNMNLTGDAEFELRADRCKKAAGSTACEADTLVSGEWNGTASMRGRRENITGLFVGSTDEKNMPEITYGGKGVDAYMAEHSVCRGMLKKEQEPEASTNTACLMGNLNNKSPKTNNYCSHEKCKGKTAVVVCNSDGTFNEKYENASVAQIIKDANAACVDANNKTGVESESCKNNPEIINDGNGITNNDCQKNNCNNSACKDNISIVVCDGESGSKFNNIQIAEACECKALPEDEKKRNDTEDYCTSKEKTDCYINACKDHCEDPECIMNSEITECTSGEAKVEKIEELAAYDFQGFTTLDGLKGAACGSNSLSNNSITLNLPEKCALLAGMDGKLASVGVKAGDDAAGTVVLKLNEGSDFKDKVSKVTKIIFKLYAGGRSVAYGDEGNKVDKPAFDGEWQTITYEQKGGMKLPFELSIQSNNDAAKALKIDDIQVFGVKKIDSGNSDPEKGTE